MRAAFKILSLVVIYCIVATGFKASISRVQLKSIQKLPIYVATNDDSRESRNIFREMVQAFVDAFPTMLQPQKEMDVEKVNTFEKTQKWVKPSSAIGFKKSDKRKSALSRQEQIDHFLEEFFPTDEDKLMLSRNLNNKLNGENPTEFPFTTEGNFIY
mmetsp:Transcript_6150/g.6315  ORF Transcript_6150/g.6315 Transcript_6150/m.6315 type:complete len:157 (+) Transcript_6150:108-578(+)